MSEDHAVVPDVAELVRRLRAWGGGHCNEAADAIERQAAELAALRVDAGRYRYLREHARDRNVWQPVDAPERLDAAVDDAIAAIAEKQK